VRESAVSPTGTAASDVAPPPPERQIITCAGSGPAASLPVQVGDGGFPAGAREGREHEGRWRTRRRDRCVRAAGKQSEADVAAAADERCPAMLPVLTCCALA
jgi:hypothetical protein